MLAHSYARHVPAHIRVGQFVADHIDLGFIFPFLHEFPESDVFVVGGTTRDAILGRVPNGIHLVIHGVPQQTINAWTRAKRLPKSLDITLPASHIWNANERNLVTTRHHTLPIAHDLAGRDATVNAMAYSVRSGMLHDPFNGLKDIDERVLRTIGDPEKSFESDPSRITRFLRHASELDFNIEDHAWHAINKHARTLNRLSTGEDGKARFSISRSHIGKDFVRALHKNPVKAFEHFVQSGVLYHVAPEFEELEKIETKDGVSAKTEALEALGYLHDHGASATVILAALISFFESGASEALGQLSKRLHLPLLHHTHISFDELSWLIEHRHVLDETDPNDLSLGEFAHIFGGERGSDLLLLLQAIAVTSKKHSTSRERLYAAKRRKETLDESAPKLLRGRDLLTLGLEPGPHLRSIMHKIRDAQLEGAISSKLDALEYARKLVGAM